MRDRDNHNDHESSDEDYLAFLRGTQPTRPQPARPQPPRQDPSRPGSPSRVTRTPGAATEPGRRGRHRLTGRLSRPLLLGTVAAATLAVLVGAGVALAPRTPTLGDGDAADAGLLDTAVAASEASPGATTSPAPTSASPSPGKSARATESPAPRKTRTTAPAPTSAPAPRATGSGTESEVRAATTDDYADERRQVLALVNTERAKAGCGALSAHSRLTTAAQRHSEDQAAHRNMSHTGSDGSNVGTRVTRAGYTWSAAAENVAVGYPDAAAVMQGWMNSPGHRKNILNCTYRHLGVGVADGGSLYWTQVFAAAG